MKLIILSEYNNSFREKLISELKKENITFKEYTNNVTIEVLIIKYKLPNCGYPIILLLENNKIIFTSWGYRPGLVSEIKKIMKKGEKNEK